jgi:apolipoprotein N-acyltransferase
MAHAVLAGLPLASGALAILSLPSFDLGFLGWLSLAPLLFALRQRGAIAGAGLGLLFGCLFAAGTFWWLHAIPGVTPFRFVLLMVALGLYYAVFGVLYALASRSIGSWIILGGPVLWVALEYARASLSFVALPWNFLAHSQYRYLPVIQIADLTGAFGISFILLMANQLASQLPDLLMGRSWRWRAHSLTLALTLGATLLYGWRALATSPESSEHVRVALVQANVTARYSMSPREQMAHLGAYDRLSREAAKDKLDLIVWPSSSLPAPISLWTVRMYINDVAHRTGAHLLVGGAGGDKAAPPRRGFHPFSNSEFLISPHGRLEGQYNKVHLTPFTEYVPLGGWITWPGWITTLERSFVAGDGYTLFRVGEARFGAPICWESAFADLFRRFVLNGANFMVSVTNEGAFGLTSGPQQTLAMNVFRAVENRVAIARAATTGVSAFIDSKGAIVSRVRGPDGADLFVPGFLVWNVPLSGRKTVYTLYGDVFAQAMTGAALAILLVVVFTRRRVRAVPRDSETRARSPEVSSP